MTIATALWWTYFDWVAIVLEHRLRETTGTAQTTLARDAFSYLHFVLVAGIVLFAMSLKKALSHYDAHLAVVPATALCAGLGAYLLAHVLLRYRISGTIGHGRPVAFAALMVLWPFADNMPALASMSIAAAIYVALIAYEAIRYREPRSFIRHGGVPTPEAMRAQRVRTG
jgi:low temperature requirement protein LtrA